MIQKILLVDDDDYKIANIKSFLEGQGKYAISIENALNPGLKRLIKEQFDLILLDMSMPTFKKQESENFNSFGGISFLKEMKRKKNITPVIIITQYELFGEGANRKTSDAIDQNCKEEFSNYKGIVIYSAVEHSWKKKLVELMGE